MVVRLREDELERDLKVQSRQGWEERSVSRDGKDSAGFPAWLRAPSGPLGAEDHLDVALGCLWCQGMPELPCQDSHRGQSHQDLLWVSLGPSTMQ